MQYAWGQLKENLPIAVASPKKTLMIAKSFSKALYPADLLWKFCCSSRSVCVILWYVTVSDLHICREQFLVLPLLADVVSPHGAQDAAGVVRNVGGVIGRLGHPAPHGHLGIVSLHHCGQLPVLLPLYHCWHWECCTMERGLGLLHHRVLKYNKSKNIELINQRSKHFTNINLCNLLKLAAGGGHRVLDWVTVWEAVATAGWVHGAHRRLELIHLPGVAAWHRCIIGPGQVPGDTPSRIGDQAHVTLQQAVA